MDVSKPLSPAQLQIDAHRLVSTHYDDIYFSNQDGFAESQQHFLDANCFSLRAERFLAGETATQCQTFSASSLSIAELGFGSGLNFLLTLQAWKTVWQTAQQGGVKAFDKAQQGKYLTYVACEKHPISWVDLEKLYTQSAWQSFAPFSQPLLRKLPPANHGFYLLEFAEFNANLLLLYGDVRETLPELLGEIDIWYLDGFAPSKNPAMWQAEVFQQIKRLSHRHTTLSTFSSAGDVRRALQDIGANVTKHPGFGNKREMLCADFTHMDASDAHTGGGKWVEGAKLNNMPPFEWAYYPDHDRAPKTIAIVGAGIAGASLANSLARRGQRVLLLEQRTSLAGASAVPAASTHLHPSHANSHKRCFDLSAYWFAIQRYGDLAEQTSCSPDSEPLAWRPCGVMDVDGSARQSQLRKGFSLPKDWLRFTDYQGQPATFYPQSGAVCGAVLLKQLLQHPNITVLFDSEITAYQHDLAAECWRLSCDNTNSQQILDDERISHLVLTTGYHTPELLPEVADYCKSVRGQLSPFVLKPASRALLPDFVVCQKNMLIKTVTNKQINDKTFYAGGSYDWQDLRECFKDQDDAINQRHIEAAHPQLQRQFQLDEQRPRFVGVRLASHDTLPMIGMLPDREGFRQTYAYLAKNARATIRERGPYQPHLHVSFAMGSKGMIYGFLGAEILTALILNTPIPIPFSELQAINPARFLIRQLKRGEWVDK